MANSDKIDGFNNLAENQVNDYIANDFNKAMPKEANGLNKGNDLDNRKPMPEYKAVGGIYQCENCGNDYTAKTTWQKYCPTCSAERKAGVMKSKKFKKRWFIIGIGFLVNAF